MERTEPCIPVQGPAWGDAQFYGEWLLAAAKAETFWKETYTQITISKSRLIGFGCAASGLRTWRDCDHHHAVTHRKV
jgi:hypothetical protein